LEVADQKDWKVSVGKLTDVKAYTKIGVFAPKLKDKDRVLEEIVAIVGHHEIRILQRSILLFCCFVMERCLHGARIVKV
jgi:hypothetical protein